MVKVAGTRLVSPDKSTVKLEGAVLRGYRSITIAGTCDPAMIANLDAVEASVRDAVATNLSGTIDPAEFTLRFLRYGLDGVTGRRLAGELPREVGLVIEAIAPTQALADTIVSLARSTALAHALPPTAKRLPATWRSRFRPPTSAAVRFTSSASIISWKSKASVIFSRSTSRRSGV